MHLIMPNIFPLLFLVANAFAAPGTTDNISVVISSSPKAEGQKTDGKFRCKVIVPKPILKTLKAYNPAFQPYLVQDYDPKMLALYDFTPQSCPSTVVGDFNGDGIPDAFFEGHAGDMYMVLVVLSESTQKYTVQEIKNEPQKKAQEYEFAKGKWTHLYKFEPKGINFDCGGDMHSDMRKLPVNGVSAEILTSDYTHKFLTPDDIYIWNTEEKWHEWCAPFW